MRPAGSSQFRISITLVLSVSLLVLAVLPAFLFRNVVLAASQQASETEVTRLKLGTLSTAREYLTSRLTDLAADFEEHSVIKGLSASQSDPGHGIVGQAYLFALSGEKAGIVHSLEKDKNDGRAITLVERDYLVVNPDSQSLALLREYPKRRLWVGQLSFIPQLPRGLWVVGQVDWNGQPAILASSLESGFLNEFIQRLEAAVESQVFLVAADNNVIWGNGQILFGQPWTAQALSRTREGEFFAFKANWAEPQAEEVLVHVYADPRFLFNLIVVTPTASLSYGVTEAINATSLLTGGVSCVVGSLCFLLVWLLKRRLALLTRRLAAISDGRYEPLPAVQGFALSEISRISEGINSLASRLAENARTIAESRNSLETRVNERTAALSATLAELRSAQDRLVQTEKMAALGRTVAAYTHEINNPLGAAVTTVSKLSQTVQELKRAHHGNALTVQRFLEGLDLIETAADMAMHNLERASTITGSFKHVASDQSHREERSFELASYLDEVVRSLRPLLRSGVHSLSCQIEPGIRLQGDPAPWYQIISNLVLNSLKHGFEGRARGTIAITAQSLGPWVTLDYRDDGNGLTPESRERLFEPFFTTKRDQGGTGLGMSIVYRLVTEELKGSIECESQAGQGIRFLIHFPIDKAAGSAPAPRED